MRKISIPVKRIMKICLFILICLLIQAAASYLYIRQSTYTQLKHELTQLTENVIKDLNYRNGKWDVSLYISDPETPHPHGSGGAARSFYIITADGFIIERTNPIAGYLDFSDFVYLQQFKKPATITTVTDEKWRIYSQPIVEGNKEMGTIVTSFYNPREQTLQEIDTKLLKAANQISSNVKVTGKNINTKNVDIRRIDYEITFEVVDNFNRVVLNSGRTPGYIDRSYIAKEIENTRHEKIFTDTETQIPYLLVSKPIFDKNGNPIALITLGQSVQDINNILHSYIVFIVVSGLLVMVPLSWLMLEFINHHVENEVELRAKEKNEHKVNNIIAFSKKDSTLKIDEVITPIPYASNQYYILEAMFSHPKKRWEQDELLERFGEVEGAESWRKVYDAHLAINRKVGFKLIDYKDKLYRFNKEYLDKILH